MDRTVVGSFLLVLGLLLVAAVGGVAGEELTADDAIEVSDDSTDVEIDAELREADGEVRVGVSLTAADGVTGQTDLQQHADATQGDLLAFADRTAGVDAVNAFWITNVVVLDVDTDRVSLDAFSEIDHVEALFDPPEFEALSGAQSAGEALSAGDDVTADSYTYGLEQINAPAAWDQHDTQGEGASVAVLDTGIDDDHPDLEVDKWAEFDGDGDPVDSDPNDPNGHGTHVAGTAVGTDDPAGDVPAYSVAPGADLYGVKVLDGGGTFEQIIAGMEWAVDENADIISMSLGADGTFDEMVDPVVNAHAAGTVVVASSGNSGEGISGSPGNVYDSIGIGASDANADIASFSSGEEIDTESAWSSPPEDWPSQYTVPTVAAPGVDVTSAWPGGGYDELDGTSMSAPHVSGAIALALSAVDGSPAPAVIGDGLEETAWKPDDAPAPPGERDTRYGSGIIDANAFTAFLDGVDDEPLLTLSTDGPEVVETDEELEIDYTVENIGGETGTESAVNLLVEDTVEDSDTDITLDPDESVSGTLTFEDVDDYDEGDLIDWTVELEDWAATSGGETGVGALPEPDIVIESIDHPDTIEATDDLDVEYTLENLGLEDGEEGFVDLLVDGTDDTWDDTDSNVEVPGGETVSGTLTFDEVSEFFEEGDTIQFTVELWDWEDVAAGEVDVGEDDDPPGDGEFAVDIEGADVPIEGEDLLVIVDVENVGSETATQTVELDVDGLGSDETELELGGGESTQKNMTVGTEEGDAGQYEAVVTSEDDQDSTPILVVADAEFVVDIVDATETVEAGEDIEVTAEIENVGDVEDTQTVALEIDGLGEDAAEIELPFGESTEETFSVSTEEDDSGTYDAVVASADDQDSVTVDVGADTEFAIVDIETSGPVVEGEALDVTVTVENVGEDAGTHSVSASIEGIDEDSTAVELGSGESADVSLTLATAVGDAGEHEVSVETPHSWDSTTAELHLPVLPNQDGPPQDVTGDGEYEDVSGTGVFDIFDVLVFFNYYESGEVQEHSWAFDFDDDGEVNIFDVQALFAKLEEH